MAEPTRCSRNALRAARWWRLALLPCLLAPTLIGCAASRPRLNPLPPLSQNQQPPAIVIGFVGFIDHADDPRLSVVQLGDRLHETYPSGVYVQVFRNRDKKKAQRTIRELLDTNHDGDLSPEEREQAEIILYGHSWGGATAISLSRALEKDQIPVALTVQVDSVHKLGQNDSRIPPNVREAVNFYQPHGFFHGRRKIVAVDPERTDILGNYRFEYAKNSVHCPPSFSWYEMFFARGHIQMDCDPKVWADVESLIRARLPAASDDAAGSDRQAPSGENHLHRMDWP